METKVNVVRSAVCGHFTVTAENADGTLAYGQALAAKMTELTELVMKSDQLIMKFGEGYIPVHVAASLPALPDGYEFVIGVHTYNGEHWIENYPGDELDSPVYYEWRVYAVRVGSVLIEGEGEIKAGSPALLSLYDEALRTRMDLPPDSLEWKGQAWVACDAIVVPFRFRGKDLPLPPEGYGIVGRSESYKDYGGEDQRLIAVPLGIYTLHDGDHTRQFEVGAINGSCVSTDGARGPYWTPPEDSYVFDQKQGLWRRPEEREYW